MTPIIQIDNFLTPTQLGYCLADIHKYKGSYSREGYENRKRLVDSIDPRYCGTQVITNPRTILHSIWQKFFWNSMEDRLYDHGDYAFKHALTSREGSVLLSVYGGGDYYGKHIDTDMGSVVTAVLFLCFKQSFTGGDLVLEDTTIPFQNNRLVVFPSCVPHEVTKISLDSQKYEDHRFTLQYFISATPTKTPLVDESSNI